MKKTASAKKGFVKIIASALAAVTIMTAAVFCVSGAAGSESIKTGKPSAVSVTEVRTKAVSNVKAGKVFGIGDKIVLNDQFVEIDDIYGGTVESCKGEFKLDTDLIGFTMKGQFEFIGLFGKGKDLCITALDAPSTRPCDVKGIKAVSGTGEMNDPFRFEVVFK